MSAWFFILVVLCILAGIVDIATARRRRFMTEERKRNRRRPHVPYREIGFTACDPQERR